VIRGWDIGVASMQLGERATFFIKSEYGYGPTGSPPKIPGGATLVFDIELYSFAGEDVTKEKDGGIIKRTKTGGDGYNTPNDGAQVGLDLVCRVEGGKMVDERQVEFELGEGLEINIPHGLELAIRKMKLNETALVTLKPKYGFGANGCPDLGIGAETTLEYEIKLTKLEKSTESWQMDADQKLVQAELFKEKGTKFFKLGKFEIADLRYSKAIEFLEHEISLKGEEEEKRKSILQACRLNVALCKMKQLDWLAARNLCTKVVDDNRGSGKAWFRRGECNYALNDWEAARRDYAAALAVEPDNKAAKNKIVYCEQKIKLYKAKEKKTFANMFDKFADIDNKKEEAEKLKRPDTMNNIDQWTSSEKNGVTATDPNSIQVVGDIDMSMDINQAIEEDRKQEEEEQIGV